MTQGNALPAALANRQRRSIVDDATSGLSAARGAHISIRGNRFRLIDAGGNEFLVPALYVDVIVVDANQHQSKIYYEGDYDPNNDAPPACFSDNGTGPSAAALQPQAPTCAACPHNVIGSQVSKVSGRGIKACSDRKKLGVIIPGDTAVNVYELQVPPNSLKPFREYANFIRQQATGVEGRKLDIADLLTRVEFVPDMMGTLKFSAVGWADDERTVQIIQYIDANHLSDAAVGRNDVARDPAAVQQLLLGRGPAQALGAPTAPVAPAPQQLQLPPRTAIPPGLPPTAPAPAPAFQTAAPPAQGFALPAEAAPRAPGRPRKPRAAPEPAPNPAVAPFMAAAQTAPAPQQAAPAAAQPLAAPPNLDIPDFLRRAPDPAPAEPAAPRFGIGEAPQAPPNVAAAVASAMQLPTRR